MKDLLKVLPEAYLLTAVVKQLGWQDFGTLQ